MRHYRSGLLPLGEAAVGSLVDRVSQRARNVVARCRRAQRRRSLAGTARTAATARVRLGLHLGLGVGHRVSGGERAATRVLAAAARRHRSLRDARALREHETAGLLLLLLLLDARAAARRAGARVETEARARARARLGARRLLHARLRQRAREVVLHQQIDGYERKTQHISRMCEEHVFRAAVRMCGNRRVFTKRLHSTGRAEQSRAAFKCKFHKYLRALGRQQLEGQCLFLLLFLFLQCNCRLGYAVHLYGTRGEARQRRTLRQLYSVFGIGIRYLELGGT